MQKIINKTNRMLGLIKRTLGYSAPLTTKKQLYLTLVCSQLDYFVCVWSETTKQNVFDIERVQCAATRYILDFPKMCSKDCLKELNYCVMTIQIDYTMINNISNGKQYNNYIYSPCDFIYLLVGRYLLQWTFCSHKLISFPKLVPCQ